MPRGIKTKAAAAPLDGALAGARQVLDLPLDQVAPDPGQPRRHFAEAPLEALAADIARRGVQQPILVFRAGDGDGYRIKTGERRWRASRLAGRETVPAIVVEAPEADGTPSVPDLDHLLDQAKENLLREQLNPVEIGWVLRRMRDDHQIPVQDIPARLGEHGMPEWSRSHVSNLIRLTELPEPAQALIRDGVLTGAHGKYLAQAARSPAVLDAVLADIDREAPPRVETLQGAIYQSFCRLATPLWVQWGPEAVAFDPDRECNICPQRCAVSSPYGEQRSFCLDRECYDRKQAAAWAEQESAEQAQADRDAALISGADPGAGADEGRSEEPPAVAPRKLTLWEIQRTLVDALGQWCRDQIMGMPYAQRQPLQDRLFLWMAAGSPQVEDGNRMEYGWEGVAGPVLAEHEAWLTQHSLTRLALWLEPHVIPSDAEACAVSQTVCGLSKPALCDLARHLGHEGTHEYHAAAAREALAPHLVPDEQLADAWGEVWVSEETAGQEETA